MFLILTFLAVFASGTAFYFAVPLQNLFSAFQPMIVAASIMVAAILVRLNRGMPSLDWKSLEPSERNRLTAAIVDLTKEYIVIVATNGVLLIVLIGLMAVGSTQAANWPILGTKAASALVGALLVLCLFRMAYVVWRDYDIVCLQRTLIDAASTRDAAEKASKAADANVANMRQAAVKQGNQTASGRPSEKS